MHWSGKMAEGERPDSACERNRQSFMQKLPAKLQKESHCPFHEPSSLGDGEYLQNDPGRIMAEDSTFFTTAIAAKSP